MVPASRYRHAPRSVSLHTQSRSREQRIVSNEVAAIQHAVHKHLQNCALPRCTDKITQPIVAPEVRIGKLKVANSPVVSAIARRTRERPHGCALLPGS